MAVQPCQERFHEETRTYADCVRYVANRVGGRPQGNGKPAADSDAPGAVQLADWQRLGALSSGWTRADLLGLMGDADADAAARELAVAANELQQHLKVPDAALEKLTGIPHGNFQNRRQALLQKPTAR